MEVETPYKFLINWKSGDSWKAHSLIMTPSEETNPEPDTKREKSQDYKDTVFLPEL